MALGVAAARLESSPMYMAFLNKVRAKTGNSLRQENLWASFGCASQSSRWCRESSAIMKVQ